MAGISSSIVVEHEVQLSRICDFVVRAARNNSVRTSSIHKAATIGHDGAIRTSFGRLDVGYLHYMRWHEATSRDRGRECQVETCCPFRERLQAASGPYLEINTKNSPDCY